jgi:putative ABC transport system permease protein
MNPDISSGTTVLTASRWFWRGLKRGEWLWLWLAVMIASSSVVLVEQLARSVHMSMLARAAESLAADLVVRSSRPLPETLQTRARALGLQVSESISLTTMVMAHDDFQLVRLKGHSANSPLRGERRSRDGLTLDDLSSGQLLAEPQLQTLLNVDKGTPLLLGRETFHIADWIISPNRLFTSFSAFAPQLVLPLARVKALGLIGPGSRVSYELGFAGDSASIKRWQASLASENNPHWRILSASAPTADLQRSLDTAWIFLDLSSLATVLIAGLAILIASRFYLQRWISSMALMRAAGASNRQLTLLFAAQLTWLALLGSLLGAIVGIILFHTLTPWLGNHFDPLVLASPGRAILLGLASGTLALWTFAWPAFRQATRVSPLRVFRQLRPRYNPLAALLVSLLLLIALMSVLLNRQIIIWALPALLISAGVFYLLALGLLAGIRRLQPLSTGRPCPRGRSGETATDCTRPGDLHSHPDEFCAAGPAADLAGLPARRHAQCIHGQHSTRPTHQGNAITGATGTDQRHGTHCARSTGGG